MNAGTLDELLDGFTFYSDEELAELWCNRCTTQPVLAGLYAMSLLHVVKAADRHVDEVHSAPPGATQADVTTLELGGRDYGYGAHQDRAARLLTELGEQ